MNSKLLFITLLIISSNVFALKYTANLISHAGFTPISQSIKHFDTPDLKGNTISINKYKGSWVLLNFWATWCGYCKREMPSLQNLQKKFKDSSLKFIGISIDRGNLSNVKKFIAKNNITFPIIHDSNGIIATQYNISSVPIHYLISPDQQIVGIFKGARDWKNQKIINNLKKLIKIKNIDFTNLSTTTTDTSNLIPPQVKTEIKNNQLIIKLTLKDNPNKYLIKVPKVQLPKELSYSNVSSSSLALKNKTILIYTYNLDIKKYDTFELGPIEIIYDDKKRVITHPSFTHKFKSPPPYPNMWFYVTLCALIFVIIFIILYVFILNKKNKTIDSNIPKNLSKFMHELNKIKILKVNGNQQEYQKELLYLYKKILPLNNDLEKELNSLLEKVSYSGKLLNIIETSNIEKKIERILKSNKNEEEETNYNV